MIPIRTVQSTRRFYLLNTKSIRDDSIITMDDVYSTIHNNLVFLFGKNEFESFGLEVKKYELNVFVVSCVEKKAIGLRSGIFIPPNSSPNIESWRIIGEAGFLQTLLHKSRDFFKPL